MKKLRWLAIAAALAASCASQRPASHGAQDWGCKITADKAREVSASACYAATNAGVVLCTPPVPAIAGVMVCESAANGVTLGAMSIDSAAIAENGTATQTVSAPIVMPNGEVAAVVACAINRKRNSVVYALLTRGPTSQPEADYLRSLDACAD